MTSGTSVTSLRETYPSASLTRRARRRCFISCINAAAAAASSAVCSLTCGVLLPLAGKQGMEDGVVEEPDWVDLGC